MARPVRSVAALLLVAASALADGRPAPSPARRTPLVMAVERTKSAVVNINAQEVVRASQNQDALSLFFGGNRRQRDEVRTSLGSGFVFDAAGYVLTNFHVIANGTRIAVSFDDGTDYTAKVVGTDPGGDLAVLKIDGNKQFPAAPIGTSSDLMLGEPAIAIGNPFGLNQSVSVGVISALHRAVPADGRSYYDFIQTDSSINPGNSGGPLLNAEGAVIGVCSAIYANAQGIGFAIPIDRATRIAHELVRSGEIADAYWGFQAEPIEQADPRSQRAPKLGAKVDTVDDASPAKLAGLLPGDVVIRADNAPVHDPDELRFLLHDIPVGAPVKLAVQRGGEPIEVALTARVLTPEQAQTLFENRTGIAMKVLTIEEAKTLGYQTNRPVISVALVERGSAAARVGLRRGDLIRALNSAELESFKDLRTALRQARKSGKALLLIQRGYSLSEVPFDLG
jgi:serine protease Do